MIYARQRRQHNTATDRRPEVLDNGDGSGNNEGSEDAGEEDVDGVGDQPGKQQQSGLGDCDNLSTRTR